MKIKVLTVGKLKEDYLKKGIAEYAKRLNRFGTVEMVEVADEKTPEKASAAENQQIKAKEAERIQGKIGERDFVVVLAIEGKELASEDFAQKLEAAKNTGHGTLTFIIGGSLGLDPAIKKRANLLLSFGRLTLPHQLMRLVLVEQIYRAMMISAGSTYHK
ncbi:MULTISPECIES: 23S rRNA (pseudouridine(1915)-N(3))-methyltransferase RlmH [Fructobacillus]|jgi:23S rRNA (pseudouridine1915-N3)-methyltransferase|uniref:Ribosomal RNA large subunit methyltransferase H n=1 Tax=Fructobacillus cardui TaxID=2893170 RepID=A0ABN9YVZ7_9LACO|nr:23S rRNA (pseudouridine(1915)-N(3))-methyltransferase RlmH [Fructobacillus sp. EFB-N1]KMK53589.1 Ribosomal RNA large subunit methyltransferase H [Fructobacillus sp. EFB-N1]CAK1221798.1 23S rRNA pseudoU1915 N3-methylase RlmH (RlmH) [Fructobacillus cardui]CAK1248441.1 23S rRNA pseudoU1915 N3-methylase RlmH (RlmH) [Fructobacillus cardui]CAK1249548.1 23S rRNA pseudoU1915 N3-methylase RlmH (RlmH) [Fructobacillus cardui]